MNGFSDATFHPPWKACKDAISSTETNSMTGSDCCFDAAKQTKIQGKKLFYSVKHLRCTRKYSKHWECQDNIQTWSIPSTTRNDWAYQESRLSFLPHSSFVRLTNIKVSSLSDFLVCTCVCKARVFLYGAAPYFWDSMRSLIEHKTHQLTILPKERTWLASLGILRSLPPSTGILGTLQAPLFTRVLRIWPHYNSLRHFPSP